MICDCTAGKCMHCLTNEQQEQIHNLFLCVAQIATDFCGRTNRCTAQRLLWLQGCFFFPNLIVPKWAIGHCQEHRTVITFSPDWTFFWHAGKLDSGFWLCEAHHWIPTQRDRCCSWKESFFIMFIFIPVCHRRWIPLVQLVIKVTKQVQSTHVTFTLLYIQMKSSKIWSVQFPLCHMWTINFNTCSLDHSAFRVCVQTDEGLSELCRVFNCSSMAELQALLPVIHSFSPSE